MNLRGAPVLDADGRPVGRRDPVELGPTQDLAVYAVDMTVDRRRATPEDLARLEAAEPTYLKRQPTSRSAQQSSTSLGRPSPARAPAARTEAPAPRHPWRQYPLVAAIPATVEEDPVTTPASPPALPCDDCLHEPVCYLRRELNHPETLLREPHILGPGLRLVFDAARVECDHQLPHALGGPMPAPGPTAAERAAASRRRGTARSLELRGKAKDASSRYPLPRDRAERDRVVLAAVRATSTMAEAGERLGVSDGRVGQVLKEIREAGAMPADIEAVLEARKSRGPLLVPAGEAVPA